MKYPLPTAVAARNAKLSSCEKRTVKMAMGMSDCRSFPLASELLQVHKYHVVLLQVVFEEEEEEAEDVGEGHERGEEERQHEHRHRIRTVVPQVKEPRVFEFLLLVFVEETTHGLDQEVRQVEKLDGVGDESQLD
eukprot:CAMPEP_0202979080 /NCGR_PEP_ID=MMETSP1396-20130829/85327_1 /ASSEMBLY_ACC=CAM_ASM_000872 /TAXON_ID= /ORGANISM="Pseudokeronopsis sp., Strain Brazil" /LENGTH=134 /DNA_ID=CAMNT_0049718343 /DNA_START=1006 /DNA_END=1409 /DNA_ORIENTATION=+